MEVWYIDSTLRDGEQAPGVSFSPAEKMKIAQLLDEINIDEAEIGSPAMGKKEIEVMNNIANAGFSFRTTSWCRALESDIFAAIKADTDAINISFPVSECHLKAMNKTESWTYSQIPRLLSMAGDYFPFVSIGLQDASRADYGVLKNIISLALDFNAKRVRIADTVGCLNPFTTQQLFSDLLLDFPTANFEFHGHNDLGMATANSLAAFLSGAKSISTTINGLGERAGNASLDEVVMALKYSANIKPTIVIQKLQQISEYVARVSGRPLPVSKPITGEKVFQHESGIHASSLLKDKFTYQLINKADTGRDEKTEIVFGKHSGTNALADFYENNGIHLNDELISYLLQQVKIRSCMKKDNLCDSELMELFFQLT
jgi:homocitrate synthase NifV